MSYWRQYPDNLPKEAKSYYLLVSGRTEDLVLKGKWCKNLQCWLDVRGRPFRGLVIYYKPSRGSLPPAAPHPIKPEQEQEEKPLLPIFWQIILLLNLTIILVALISLMLS